jgi:hypothetical protein
VWVPQPQYCRHPVQVSGTTAGASFTFPDTSGPTLKVASSSATYTGSIISGSAKGGTLLNLKVGSTSVFDVSAAGTASAHAGLTAKAGATVTGATVLQGNVAVSPCVCSGCMCM